MPGRLVPVLDVDEPEIRLAPRNLDGADVECLSLIAPLPARFADQGGLGPVLEHHQRMAQVDTPLPRQADQAENGRLDRDPFGHIEQRTTRPEMPCGAARISEAGVTASVIK